MCGGRGGGGGGVCVVVEVEGLCMMASCRNFPACDDEALRPSHGYICEWVTVGIPPCVYLAKYRLRHQWGPETGCTNQGYSLSMIITDT